MNLKHVYQQLTYKFQIKESNHHWYNYLSLNGIHCGTHLIVCFGQLLNERLESLQNVIRQIVVLEDHQDWNEKEEDDGGQKIFENVEISAHLVWKNR